MTVRENVALGAEALWPVADAAPAAHGRRRRRRGDRARPPTRPSSSAASPLADRLGRHPEHRPAPPVELARVAAGGFRFLLLDEPSSGLDDDETDASARSCGRSSAERGVGILLVEHDMALVMAVCDYLFVLDFGQLIFEGTPAEVQAQRRGPGRLPRRRRRRRGRRGGDSVRLELRPRHRRLRRDRRAPRRVARRPVGPGGRPPRPQRRRQDDAAVGGLRAAPTAGPGPCVADGVGRHPAPAGPQRPGGAVPRHRGPQRLPRPDRAGQPAALRPPRRGGRRARPGGRGLPPARRAARASRRHDERRRAADAGPGPGLRPAARP